MTIVLNQSEIEVARRIAIPIAEKIKQMFESGTKLEVAFRKAFDFFDINRQIVSKYWELTRDDLELSKVKPLIERVKLEAAFLVEGLMSKSENLAKITAFMDKLGVNKKKSQNRQTSPIPKKITANTTFSVKKVTTGAIVKIKKKQKKDQPHQFTIDCEGSQVAEAVRIDTKKKKGKKGTFLVSCKPKND